MKKDRFRKRLAAALICLFMISTALPAFLPHLWFPSAHAAEESRHGETDFSIYSRQAGGRSVHKATSSGLREDPDREDGIFILQDDITASSSDATPSDTTSSDATPSDADREIISVYVPDLATLAAGEADDHTWQDALPRQAAARTAEEEDLWCDLQWSVPNANWDHPGIYAAQVEVIPPDGYTMKDPDRSYPAVVSIRPPGTSQVMEVFTYMRYGMKGHTWTFAMKTGQDMTPLVEALENISVYSGILDDPFCNISFSAEWDFSSVNPDRPGIYPIYRSLTIIEDSLPKGVSPDEIHLPDYWKDMPVLFSVEAPGGPQLSGVLENPYDFFGSYARLNEEELDALEVWYSIDEGSWTLQTDEGLMDACENNFYIHKDAMAEGSRYSFRLKLGDFISRELVVQKDETSPVWFTSIMDGNRDGTIDVEFPSISQPPPIDPPEPDTKPVEPDTKPDEPDIKPVVPDTKPDGPDTKPVVPDTKPSKPAEDEAPQPPPTIPSDSNNDSTISPQPPFLPVPETETPPYAPPVGDFSLQPTEAPRPVQKPSLVSREELPAAASKPAEETEPSREAAVTDGHINMKPGSSSGSLPVPEEEVTRWSTRISGKRVRKLVELYPDWIRFQKENVSILLSSQWLKDQQMKDSDVLTVSVSPDKDHTVTILINQKEPQPPPVCQVTIGEAKTVRFDGTPAKAVLILAAAGGGAALLWKRRWRS